MKKSFETDVRAYKIANIIVLLEKKQYKFEVRWNERILHLSPPGLTTLKRTKTKGRKQDIKTSKMNK